MKLFKLRISEKWRIYLTFVFINVMCSLGLFCTRQFHHRHMQSVQQLKQQLQSVRMRHSALRLEQAVIQHYLPQYQTLITQGLIGKEQRGLWVNQLRQVQQSQQLFPVSYSILARQTLESNQGAVQLYRTPMKIELDLLHEADLLRFLERLEASHVGIFALRECSINRLSPSDKLEQKLAPNLHARCTRDWFTMSEKTALAEGDAP
jgi:hypothetical protein